MKQALGRKPNQAGLLGQRSEFPRRPGPGALAPPGHKEAPRGASEHPTQQEVPPETPSSQNLLAVWLDCLCFVFYVKWE